MFGTGRPAAPHATVSYAFIVQRAPAIIGSAIFLIIAPGTLAVYVPWLKPEAGHLTARGSDVR